jgi:hypothetical protein
MTPKVALFAIASLSVAIALGQSPRPLTNRPIRRESPVRTENIRDQEVREIQSVMSQLQPGALVNIGTVVTGCPCEDGPSCTDQVWVVAYRPDESVGLVLSRIDGRWGIGPLQQWWLDSDDLEARRKSFRSYGDYIVAQEALAKRHPKCVVESTG